MKKLILIRHAKSSWDNTSISDKERPLNARGKKAAPFMAEILKKKNINIQLFISSPAERAFATAKKFADILGYPRNKILIVEKLYGATTYEILEIVNELDENLDCVAIFGHNPDLTQFNNFLSDTYIDNIPTTGIVLLNFEVDAWKEIGRGVGKLQFFDYPKKFNPLL